MCYKYKNNEFNYFTVQFKQVYNRLWTCMLDMYIGKIKITIFYLYYNTCYFILLQNIVDCSNAIHLYKKKVSKKALLNTPLNTSIIIDTKLFSF